MLTSLVQRRQWFVLFLALSTMAGTGCDDGSGTRSATEVVRAWGDALNRGDMARACDLSAPGDKPCEPRLKDFLRRDLAFDGPGGNVPGRQSFTFTDRDGTTVVVAVEPGDEGPRVDVALVAIPYEG